MSHVIEEFLEKGHAIELVPDLLKEKFLHKPLHLRPTSPDPISQDARSRRRQQRLRKEQRLKRKKKVKPLSAKEKRLTGIHEIPKDAREYDIYRPLHQMWLEYMYEILGMSDHKAVHITAQNKGSILASADYHGAIFSIVRARCASLVGIRGVVIKDTKFTFQIITPKNELKVIPKRNTIFRFDIPQPLNKDEMDLNTNGTSADSSSMAIIFELHGNQFEKRAADRATMKFKQRKLEYL